MEWHGWAGLIGIAFLAAVPILLADAGGKGCLCGCRDSYFVFPPATHQYEAEFARRWPMLRGECMPGPGKDNHHS